MVLGQGTVIQVTKPQGLAQVVVMLEELAMSHLLQLTVTQLRGEVMVLGLVIHTQVIKHQEPAQVVQI